MEKLINHGIVCTQDLADDLRSQYCRLNDDQKRVFLGLMMTSGEFDAFSVNEAIKGGKTGEKALVEVLCSRTVQQMEAMKESYKECEYNIGRGHCFTSTSNLETA